MEKFILKHLVVGKLSLFSGMLNDASMHRRGLKGYLGTSLQQTSVMITTSVVTSLLPLLHPTAPFCARHQAFTDLSCL